ncbi:MAG: MFS transporter [Gammaproteobacteria bacterium]|nr:MFS transporter [Gammaproteobacteria bacterium]
MKKYLNHPIISLKPESYLTLIIFLAPFLYFLSGINIDIYSPSMPSITAYFQTTIVATKNTISVSLLGWAFGALIFGILIDSLGRKKILVIGMFFYVVSSAVAPFSQTIHELMLIRFIQGFFISSIIGARILIMDLISGRRYMIAMLYTSIGYGLGPILGPFVGGLLHYFFGWQSNFFALAIVGAIILFFLLIFIKESTFERHPLKFLSVMKRSFSVLKHRKFMAGVLIGGITQIQLMLYPTVGPFIVEKVLHQSVMVYANSALIVGAGYLIGSLFNRLLLKYISPKQICHIGFVILICGSAISYLLSFISTIELTSIMLPTLLTSISVGFIFPNVLGSNLKQFSHTAGIAMAVQSSVLLFVSAIGIFLVSHIHVTKLFQWSDILFVLTLIEIIVFYSSYHSVFAEV